MNNVSWLRAEDSTRYMNIASCNNVGFRLLVPKPFVEEFGNEIRAENYRGAGYIMSNGVLYDMFGLLAKFNKKFLNKSVYTYRDGSGKAPNAQGLVCDIETAQNREVGMALSQDVRDVLFLRYPLKLVSLSYEGTKYEKCDGFSVLDPDGGVKQTHWDDDKKTEERHKLYKELWDIRSEYERRLEVGMPPISKFEIRPEMPHKDLMERTAAALKGQQ